MLNSPRLMDYRPVWPPRSAPRSCGGAREACEGARERLGYPGVESWAGLVPKAFESLTGEERNRIYQMLRLEVTPASEGYKVTGALGGFLHPGTDGLREATVKKLNRARLRIPSGLM